MNPPKKKTILITGAARRIGSALARAFALKGMNIAIHYRESKDQALVLKEEIANRGVRSWCIFADLTKKGHAQKLIEDTYRQAGSIDFLINSASIYEESSIFNFTLKELENNIHTNAFAPLALSRYFAQNAKNGAIVNLLDCRITDFDVKHAAYQLSKQLLHQLTRLLALELAPNVRVNAVAPGLILSPDGESDDYCESRRKFNPLRGIGHTKDVVDAALLLIQNEFITGETIFVDGGRHLRGSVY